MKKVIPVREYGFCSPGIAVSAEKKEISVSMLYRQEKQAPQEIGRFRVST